MGGTTPIFAGRVSHQGELVLGLYNVNQQRLIDNGGSVFIGDRLFLEIKYRTGLPIECEGHHLHCISRQSEWRSASDHCRELLDRIECVRQRSQTREDPTAHQPVSIGRFTAVDTLSTHRSVSREKFRFSNQ